ncbi:MAG: hypothetical protein ACRD2I_27970, partial [Vicinamibacterales bacterium]
MADRFALHEDGRAFDLATGRLVTLIIGSAGGVSEQLRWVERCATLRTLRHRAMSVLIDFGLVGETSRFEAWDCGAIVHRQDASNAAYASAARWLGACGLAAGPWLPDSVHADVDGRVVWLPDSGTGYPSEQQEPDHALTISDRGLQIVEQAAVPALAEMFEIGGARPRVAALWGVAGIGKRVIIGELARMARSSGFVPLSARLVASRQAALWSGRNLFVIGDVADGRRWQRLLNAVLGQAQPHVLLLVGEEEFRSVPGVGVGRLPIDVLAGAIRPQSMNQRLERQARGAAERAQGLPGRFVPILWPGWGADRSSRPANRAKASRVAERQAIYGKSESDDDLFEAAPVSCRWPAPDELRALRQKLDGANALLGRGRHAPGIRQLRQAVGGLARRGAWSDAARGVHLLASALLRRGQAREVLAAVDQGRGYASRAEEESTLVALAVLSGNAWIDLGRLDEADGVLGGALVAARALQDPDRVADVSVALARVCYWRGDYADADALLLAAPDSPPTRVRRALLGIRNAVGLGDLARAMRLLTTVAERAGDDIEVGTKAALAWVTAFVHFAVGDLSAVEHDLSDAVTLARAAHDRQLALRARLLRAEVDRAKGRPAAAVAQLQRLDRVAARAPTIVRARWNLAKAMAASDAWLPDLAAKHVKESGLGSLGLYV